MIVTTPPMGWNTWNTFGKNINEQLILKSADKLIDTGLFACGYNYIVIDDCWSLKERDKNGRLVADPEKFPNGIKYVADYVHSKGLKFGIYSCCGTMTCGDYPGSYEHEFIDAATFAEWGVDFLKYDFCYRTQFVPGDILYKRMGLALANCGRDILFSACSWGNDETEKWIKTTGAHMFRSTHDINDSWGSIKKIFMEQERLHPMNAQGCFNDMDMLIVGMNGQKESYIPQLSATTFNEYKTHFSAWCLFGSPLMIGCDIRNMNEDAKNILTNKELIAIDQDRAYRQPYRLDSILHWDQASRERNVYARHLENGDIAIGIFNLGDTDYALGFNLDQLGLSRICGKTLKMKELWTGEESIIKNETYLTKVEAHDCRIYRASLIDA